MQGEVATMRVWHLSWLTKHSWFCSVDKGLRVCTLCKSLGSASFAGPREVFWGPAHFVLVTLPLPICCSPLSLTHLLRRCALSWIINYAFTIITCEASRLIHKCLHRTRYGLWTDHHVMRLSSCCVMLSSELCCTHYLQGDGLRFVTVVLLSAFLSLFFFSTGSSPGLLVVDSGGKETETKKRS